MAYKTYQAVVDAEACSGADLSRSLGAALQPGTHPVKITRAVCCFRGGVSDWMEVTVTSQYGDSLRQRLRPWEIDGTSLDFTAEFVALVKALFPRSWEQFFAELAECEPTEEAAGFVRANLVGQQARAQVGWSEGYKIVATPDGGFLAVDALQGHKLTQPLGSVQALQDKLKGKSVSTLEVSAWL